MLKVVKLTLVRWFDHHMATHAAALAFYTLFALAPVVLATVFAAGHFLGEEYVRSEIVAIVGEYIGPAAARTLEQVFSDWQPPELRLGPGLVALASLLFAATAFFVQLHESLNIVWRVESHRSILVGTLYRRLFSFLMVAISGVVLLVLFAVNAALGAFDALLQDRFELPVRLLGTVNAAASLVIVAVLLTALFHFVPDARVRWRDALVGGIATAFLFELGRWLISRYLRVVSLASAYGAAGSLVVTLLWVYYVVLIILLGAEFTYAWSEHRREMKGGGLEVGRS